MFNITFNLRKSSRKIGIICFGIVLALILVLVFKRYFMKICAYINDRYESVLKRELSFEKFEILDWKKGVQTLLSSEIMIVGCNNETEFEEIDEVVSESLEEVAEETKNIDYSNLKTEVISEGNLRESYNAEYNGVKIKNESIYTLSEDILIPNIEFENKKDILIFHTHTCESYTQTKQNTYIESGNFRTTNLNYSVARVGDELTNCLLLKNFNVIHDTTYHDYPAYTGSYNRSFSTVKNIVEKNPSIQMVIDLHRDAIGSKSEYGPSVKIGDERVAELMFVIGTNGGGLSHDNWKNNLKYAVKIQEKANEMFPGLFKPIIVRNSRYNQNLADSACIIEVGATGNTLEECMGSMKYLAEVLYETMK